MRFLDSSVLKLLAVFIACGMHLNAATVTITSLQGVKIGDVRTIPNGVVTPPKVLAFTNPVYTSEARAWRIEGMVTVEALFDIDGNFTVLRVVNGLGYGLDESALAALRTWRFAPADRNAARVPVVARIEIPFRLLDDALDNLKRTTEQLEAYKAKVKALQERQQFQR